MGMGKKEEVDEVLKCHGAGGGGRHGMCWTREARGARGREPVLRCRPRSLSILIQSGEDALDLFLSSSNSGQRYDRFEAQKARNNACGIICVRGMRRFA